ncbi:SDR family NAD(P)-dependent oxidoreductase [Pseudomonas sp. MM211]|uniref:SDR family oxidoreductase n=1 Tax=Pseudomonas sp. MM211 TaxID=2866808 RepID=UPI001CECA5C7|nr:SDR family NAD(P)-dependent oxidoreductase [Pseudomonas sp. MM211]UCJ15922.1 SDR family NAD(P)-dependent oxidoreductase [Pseudomonas sp. MM211]
MKMSGNSVLITGGGSGIGLALARRFVELGNEVIICGRDIDRLDAAKAQIPAITTLRADLADASQREALVASVLEIAPKLNVLVNNSGIQRRGSFLADTGTWDERASEIAINLEAPIHLAALLLPHLVARPNATIINVSSGLAFLPLKFAAIYVATKAGLHAFSVALRADLASSRVSVIEIVPPAVDTDLGGTGLHTDGVPVDTFVNAVMNRMAEGELEIGYGPSDGFRLATRGEIEELLKTFNG